MAFFCIHCRSEIDPKFKACPFCGEPITDFLRRHLEAPIDGKYQILARLGVGGMGEVYKVLHVHLNAIRVIKLMRAAIANEAGAHERFLREARLATRIQHPSVAALYDFSTLEDGSRYMVWEFIEGINLHEMIDARGPLSPRYAARISVQALYGLDAIHRAGIVHRDISPENLMITRDDENQERVKIIDLGIAKQGGDDGDNKTKTGMFVGKWKYCSPEHLGMLEASERIDGRADIYSFGITLYEMLTGVPPFQADTPHGYLMSHASARPKALREINPTVTASPELEALIFRALEKDRRNRFATARDFAQELEKLIPTLDDAPGAAQIPVAAEVTEDATRITRERLDTETVPATLSSAAATVATQASPSASEATAVVSERWTSTIEIDSSALPSTTIQPLAEVTAVTAVTEMPSSARRWPVMVVAAIALVLLIGGGFLMMNRHAADPVASAPASTNMSVVAPQQGHLGINAFPWGEVTSIRNVDSGEAIELKSPIVTPAPLDLPPGNYEVTLSNPKSKTAVSRTVSVRAGETSQIHVPFDDPEQAALPSFGGKS